MGNRWTEDDLKKLRLGMVNGVATKQEVTSVRINLPIKPLSVNDAWKGQRFKTDEYKAYEKHVAMLLPPLQMPAPPYRFYYEFGFSNSRCDWDNPCKPLQDILQKHYGFDDRDIQEATVKKRIVKRGQEYIIIRVETIS